MQKINEVVVISGKGGTGKTSMVASLVPFIKDVVIADCDVDAPDLNILFGEKIDHSYNFIGTKKAIIDENLCIRCQKCVGSCNFKAISQKLIVETLKCEGCGVCEFVCPTNAIQLKDFVVGEMLFSSNEYGKMVHAKLKAGEETSGKLVANVRKEAKAIAKEQNLKNIIVDGSPGIACNVISSITGAKRVIIVIEPTLSGLHDLKRVYELTKRFSVEASVIINKFDLSIEVTQKIKDFCKENTIKIDMLFPFNKIMVEAISNKEIPSIYAEELFEKLNFKKIAQEYFV